MLAYCIAACVWMRLVIRCQTVILKIILTVVYRTEIVIEITKADGYSASPGAGSKRMQMCGTAPLDYDSKRW